MYDVDNDDISQQCPECGSWRTYLISPMGDFKCEECNLIVDDDYWMTNEPEITIIPENIPDDDYWMPENIPDDIPDYLD